MMLLKSIGVGLIAGIGVWVGYEIWSSPDFSLAMKLFFSFVLVSYFIEV